MFFGTLRWRTSSILTDYNKVTKQTTWDRPIAESMKPQTKSKLNGEELVGETSIVRDEIRSMH